MPAVDAAEKRRNARSYRRSRDAAADPRDGATRPPLAHRHCAFPKPVKLSQTTSVISRDFAFNRKIQAESRSRDHATVRATRSPAVAMPQARRLCHAGAGCFEQARTRRMSLLRSADHPLFKQRKYSETRQPPQMRRYGVQG